jgi:hypothetical protein
MYRVGMVKPVKITRARISNAAGAKAWERVLETEAIVRKSIDMVNVRTNEMRRKKKKFPGSLRKFDMKYKVKLKVMVLVILYGMSVSIDATASAEG